MKLFIIRISTILSAKTVNQRLHLTCRRVDLAPLGQLRQALCVFGVSTIDPYSPGLTLAERRTPTLIMIEIIFMRLPHL